MTNTPTAEVELGIADRQFTLNRERAFLLSISYYGALGASEAFIQRDLEDMQRYGFGWMRVWATWAAFGNDVSAVDRQGEARELSMRKLEWIVAESDRRGMVVDVTLSRGHGVTGPPRLQTLDAHRRAVETLVTTLRPYRNWYLDLANERNKPAPRFVSFEELGQLWAAVEALDPQRLVTASHAGDIGYEDLSEYLFTARVDFITPHCLRNHQSLEQTETKSREYLAWMEKLERPVPLHYQEPLRRGFGRQQWEAGAFVADLERSLSGGATGWCFHNGDQRDHPERLPRRSFDLREQRLFEQLDSKEQNAIEGIRLLMGRIGRTGTRGDHLNRRS